MCQLTHELYYERTEDISVLSDFFCGIEEMDRFIHNSLQEKLRVSDELKLYIIKENQQVVAITAIKESVIEVHIENVGKIDVDSLEIEYLAVKKESQRKHIGKQIIKWIESTAINNYPRSKFVSVRAFQDKDIDYSAVPFYKSCGFRVIQKPHPMANNVKMAKRL